MLRYQSCGTARCNATTRSPLLGPCRLRLTCTSRSLRREGQVPSPTESAQATSCQQGDLNRPLPSSMPYQQRKRATDSAHYDNHALMYVVDPQSSGNPPDCEVKTWPLPRASVCQICHGHRAAVRSLVVSAPRSTLTQDPPAGRNWPLSSAP